jgi:hypothetical protein
MAYKTTHKHFLIFKKECERLVNLWGLHAWRYAIVHDYLEDGRYAQCTSNLPNRVIEFALNREWNCQVTEFYLKKYARHEVIHALLGPIAWFNFCRWATKNEVDAAGHEVLELLMGLLPR